MQLARVAVSLDCSQTAPAQRLTAMRALGWSIHYLTRTLLGSPGNVFQMPLCWDAVTHQRHGGDCNDEAWWLSVDHGAIDLARTWGSFDRELVTCTDCIEWLRA